MSNKEHNIRHSKSQALIDAAYLFAKAAHGNQTRKYTGEPYITHPVSVAEIVASVTDDCEAICAALLHDVIEDTDITYEQVRDSGFGHTIANMVLELTDVSKPEDGNRETRKEIDRNHISKASPLSKTVKLADLIDNSTSIIEHDTKFAKVYMREKMALLEVLDDGDETLFKVAQGIVYEYLK